MAIPTRKMLLLDLDTRTKMASSVRLLSLNQVVMGLLENALDGQSRSIRVTLNYSRGFCSVQDDGIGIDKREFEADCRLAVSFCTSKWKPNSQPSYGRNGQFLAAVAGAALLSISSKTEGEQEQILLFNHKGRLGQAGLSSELDMVSAGTKIKVYNLFANFPVRLKHVRDRFEHQHEIEREFVQLQRDVVALHLASVAQANVLVEETMGGRKLRLRARPDASPESTLTMCDLAQTSLAQARLLRYRATDPWHDATISVGDMVIRAAFASRPVPSKHLQFVAINHFPLSRSQLPELYALVNTMFESSSSVQAADPSTRHEAKSSANDCGARQRHNRDSEPYGTRDLDRWPAFFLRIQLTLSLSTDMTSPQAFLREGHLLATVSKLVKSMIEEFLPRMGTSKLSTSTSRAAVTQKQAADYGGRGKAPVRCGVPMDQMSLNHWSRVKTTQSSVLHHTLAGLPFMSKIAALPPATTERSTQTNKTLCNCVIADDSKMTVTDPDSIRKDRPDVGPMELVDPPSCSDEKRNVIEWHDSSTGLQLMLDTTTGNVVVPHRRLTVFTSESYTGDPSTPTQLNARKRHRGLSTLTPRDLIAKIDQYVPKLRPSKREDGILSLLVRDYEHMTHGTRTVVLSSEKSTQSRLGGDEHTTHEVSRKGLAAVPTQICKEDLWKVRAIAQVDRKFILASLPSAARPAERVTRSEGQAVQSTRLALIDQHAASERIGVELLFHSLRHDPPVILDQPLVLDMDCDEVGRLDDLAPWFAGWGVHYHAYGHVKSVSVSGAADQCTAKLYVEALPAAIAERCRNQPKLVVDMLRAEVWADEKRRTTGSTSDRADPGRESGRRHGQCDSLLSGLPAADIPARLLEMINSRACRSAIMFNDELSRRQCERLMHKLATCVLPFQCAHGRPNVYVLPELIHLADLYDSELGTGVWSAKNDGDYELNTLNVQQSFADAWRSMP